MEIMLGLLTLILGTVVPIWLHRRAHPTRLLRYSVEADRMLSRAALQRPDITIEADGRPVADPYAVQLTIWSTSRADIPAAAFDSQRALVIDLGAAVIPGTLTHRSKDRSEARFQVVAERQLTLAPTLLPKTTHIVVDVVTEGEPHVVVRNPLIDIDIVPDRQRAKEDIVTDSRRRVRTTATQVTTGITVASFVLLVVAFAIRTLNLELSTSMGGIALLILIACGLTYGVIGVRKLVLRLTRSSAR